MEHGQKVSLDLHVAVHAHHGEPFGNRCWPQAKAGTGHSDKG
jgi:hypothetical protein